MKTTNHKVKHPKFGQQLVSDDYIRDTVLEFHHPGTGWTFNFSFEHMAHVAAEKMFCESKTKTEPLNISDRQTILNALSLYASELNNCLCPDFQRQFPEQYIKKKLEFDRLAKIIYRYNYNPETKKSLKK